MTAASPVLPDSVLAKRAGLAWQCVADEAVVLDIDGQVLRGMNRTAWRIWELIDGSRSLGEIAGDVATTLRADPARAQEDVLAFAEELVARALVERVR